MYFLLLCAYIYKISFVNNLTLFLSLWALPTNEQNKQRSQRDELFVFCKCKLSLPYRHKALCWSLRSVDAFTENQLEMFCSFHYSPQWKIMAKFVSRRADLSWRRCLGEGQSSQTWVKKTASLGFSGFIQQLPLAWSIHPSISPVLPPENIIIIHPLRESSNLFILWASFQQLRENERKLHPRWVHLAAKLGSNGELIVISCRAGFAVSTRGTTHSTSSARSLLNTVQSRLSAWEIKADVTPLCTNLLWVLCLNVFF